MSPPGDTCLPGRDPSPGTPSEPRGAGATGRFAGTMPPHVQARAPAPAGGRRTETAVSLTTSVHRPGRLPAEPTSFVGRREELAELARLFARYRLVTLMGPGGVGKTRLAVRAAGLLAASFEDGVRFADLSGLRDPGLLAQAVGEALGLPDQSPGAALDALVDHLSGQRALLVLDACEHLLDGCAMLVEVLLRNAPELRVLATARTPLDVTGEYALLVEPLAVPDRPPGDPATAARGEAVELFAERASAAVDGWTLTERNADAVTRLCRRLGGIPLAIELTAARLRALPVEQVAARLDGRIPPPDGGTARDGGGAGGAGASGPRELRAAIDWSHDLCTPGERLLWARLSVFAGEFDLEDATCVCADADLPPGAIAGTLAGLVSQSIVLRAPGGGTRYRMLDTLREYGAERLESSGRAGAVRARAFEHFGGTVRRAAAELGTAAQPHRLEWFRREHANVRAVMEHALRAAGDADLVRTFLGLGRLLALQGLLGEARHWAARVFAACDLARVPGRECTEVLALSGLLAVLQDDVDQGRELLDRAEARTRADGDDVRGLAYVRQAQGVAALGLDRPGDAARLLAEARDLHRLADDGDVLAPLSELFLVVAEVLDGDAAAAVRDATEVIASTAAAGELWCRSYGLCVRALALVAAGEPGRALEDARPALRIKLGLGDRLGVGLAFDMVGAALAGQGEIARAARMFGAGDAVLRFTGVSLFGLKHRLLEATYWRHGEQAIGEEAFGQAYAEGAALAFDTALAEALGEHPGG